MATVIKKCSCPDTRRCRHGWVVRYRAGGRQHEKTFPHDRKSAANDYAAQVEHEKRSGDYVDPRAGDVTFQAYAERWIAQHHGADNTKLTYGTALRQNVCPAIGGMALGWSALGRIALRARLTPGQTTGTCKLQTSNYQAGRSSAAKTVRTPLL